MRLLQALSHRVDIAGVDVVGNIRVDVRKFGQDGIHLGSNLLWIGVHVSDYAS